MNQEPINSIKAVAVDVDGTLTGPDRKISLDAISALRNAEDKGVKIMIASGNVLPIARALSTWLGASGPVVAENGGIVFFKGEVRLLTDKELPMQAYEVLKQKLGVKGIPTNKWRETEVALDPATAEVGPVRELLAELGYDLQVGTTGFAVHINNPGINKYEALKVACELIDITTDDIMAIGDYGNDYQMIKYCGLGVAVANAQPEIKSAAMYVAENPNGKGIVEALERYIF